jgi:hypothetical protein
MSKFGKMTAEATGLDASVNAVLQALREPETSGLNPAQFQAVFAEVVTAFAKYRESDKEFPAFPDNNNVSATDVAVAATGILDAADVAVFELGMWQTLKQ